MAFKQRALSYLDPAASAARPARPVASAAAARGSVYGSIMRCWHSGKR